MYSHNTERVVERLGKETLLKLLRQMLLIRNFEIRGEAAYQHGYVGGFYHSYMGQEAIQVAACQALGPDNWYIASYRCHALALLLGATPKEIMAELFGRANGNAKGRGGSMHLYTERLLGGFGIVSGQIPIATGAALSIKYLNKKDEVAICFLGDGAVTQGSFHESLNMASLWSLPCIYVIENNHWGMGTAVERAVAAKRLAEDIAPSYNIKSYTFDGMDFFNCYQGFEEVRAEVLKTGRPVLIEAICERFRGHSISDPALYRTKENLKLGMQLDPILTMKKQLIQSHFLDEETFKQMDKEAREIALDAVKFAEQSPWPDTADLEKEVFAS